MQTVLPILIPITKNVLLIKDQVGKTKSPTRELPEQNFCYGRKIDRSNIGMKEITSDWQYGFTPKGKSRNKDFRLPDIDQRYGLRNKPSTPMVNVINQSYAELARTELDSLYRKRAQTEHKKLEVHKNRAYSLRIEQCTRKCELVQPLFKLKRFKEIQAKIRIHQL